MELALWLQVRQCLGILRRICTWNFQDVYHQYLRVIVVAKKTGNIDTVINWSTPLVDESCLKESTVSVFVYDFIIFVLCSKPLPASCPPENLHAIINYTSCSKILPGYMLRDSFALHIGRIFTQLKMHLVYIMYNIQYIVYMYVTLSVIYIKL